MLSTKEVEQELIFDLMTSLQLARESLLDVDFGQPKWEKFAGLIVEAEGVLMDIADELTGE